MCALPISCRIQCWQDAAQTASGPARLDAINIAHHGNAELDCAHGCGCAMPGETKTSSVEIRLVHITPRPVRPGFDGLDERMTRGLVMRTGVAVLRAVTTADMAAGHADAQLHPAIASRHAPRTHMLSVADLVRCSSVRAAFGVALAAGQFHAGHQRLRNLHCSWDSDLLGKGEKGEKRQKVECFN